MRWLLSQCTPYPSAGTQGAENSLIPLPPAHLPPPALPPEAILPTPLAQPNRVRLAGAPGQFRAGTALSLERLQAAASTHFLELSLMVKGQPRGSTSKAVGLLLAAGRQPYLQWMKSSPICSATAMLFTTTVSLALSTGHFSAKGRGSDTVSEG